MNTETSKELNQVELMKNFIGTQKSEAGKDTTFNWEGKPYGEGLEVYVKTETKEKMVSEGKTVLAYDKNSDKFIQTQIMNVKGSLIAAMLYTSITTCEGVLNKDMSNPEIAQMKAPNKPDEISTFTLQKK